MKKHQIALILLLSLLLLFSCGGKEEVKTLPPLSDPVERTETTEEEKLTEEETKTQVPPSPVETSTQSHNHDFRVLSVTKPGCTYDGVRYLVCSCGAESREGVPALSHDFPRASCGKASVCRHCGTAGEVQKHVLAGNVCTLCSLTVTEPIYVLDQALNFDESLSVITEKLGKPTEILTEGDLKSLVYASLPTRLTVIQTDSVGLWGVFTMDPNAFFQIGDEIIRAQGFTGKKDTQSDASYRDLSSCRIYGFRDTLGDGECYGLWMRYSECYYDFMNDPRIASDYTSQCRLSYYYVNALRARHGLTSLTWSAPAAAVAKEYSEKMAAEGFFYHDNLYGTRLQEKGVVWRSCGENISQGYTGALFVCDAYYNCADHRANILNASFTVVGMGFALQEDGIGPLSVLGTQIFYS